MLAILSTMTSKPSPQPLSNGDYASKTSAVLAGIESTVDRWLEEDVIDVDTHRTGGLLELIFPDGSKIVAEHPASAPGVVARGARRRIPFPMDGRLLA